MAKNKHNPISYTIYQDLVKMGTPFRHKSVCETISKLEEQGTVYLSDLWLKEEFMTQQEIEKMVKCKIYHFDGIKFKFLHKQC